MFDPVAAHDLIGINSLDIAEHGDELAHGDFRMMEVTSG
jgi:hypothetical protein